MPNSCCAPGCKVGYKPQKKKRKKDETLDDDENVKVALFRFPTEPERRATRFSFYKNGVFSFQHGYS